MDRFLVFDVTSIKAKDDPATKNRCVDPKISTVTLKNRAMPGAGLGFWREFISRMEIFRRQHFLAESL